MMRGKYKGCLIAFILFIVVSIFLWMQYSASQEQAQLERTAQRMEDDYNKAVDLLSQEYTGESGFKEADRIFKNLQSPEKFYMPSNEEMAKELKSRAAQYPYIWVYAEYADAMNTFYGHTYPYTYLQYEAALKAFDELPLKFNGPLADKIAKDHKYVKEEYLKAKGLVDQIAKDKAAEMAVNINIGDPENKVTKILGQPENTNTDEVPGGDYKQYVYSGDRYVYVMNGVVTGLQNIGHQY